MDAATVFLQIASPPVFLAPDATTIAMMLCIWMHYQLKAATPDTLASQRPTATQQNAFAMVSSLAYGIGAHGDVALESTRLLIEELARAGCMTAMQATVTAHQQLAACTGRLPTAQAIGQLVSTMLQGGVAECAGICVGGLVRRITERILRLGGAPLESSDEAAPAATLQLRLHV
jgi:hypothetical protein